MLPLSLTGALPQKTQSLHRSIFDLYAHVGKDDQAQPLLTRAWLPGLSSDFEQLNWGIQIQLKVKDVDRFTQYL